MSKKQTKTRAYPKERLIAELKRVASLVKDHSLTLDRFDEHAVIPSSTIRKRLGRWSAALKAAGLAHRDSARVFTGKGC